ncbi:hypothetical protein VFPBJ_01926 [Purpureocillium lilacinum]|uniref:Uncharacterized protein n=1 Tax=Purpureocillium lilacinum TaxID=33203 RepID=A0A179HC82_PURLI|nr:hypothetical protein VFPBJ_01926 [Purpureocillium lilacinum]
MYFALYAMPLRVPTNQASIYVCRLFRCIRITAKTSLAVYCSRFDEYAPKGPEHGLPCCRVPPQTRSALGILQPDSRLMSCVNHLA